MNEFDNDPLRLSCYVFDNVPIHEIERRLKALRKEVGKHADLSLTEIDFAALRESLLTLPRQLADSESSGETSEPESPSTSPESQSFSLTHAGLAAFEDVDELRETTMALIEARAEKELTRAYDHLLFELEGLCDGGRKDLFEYICLFLPDRDQFASQTTPVLLALFRWISQVIWIFLKGIRTKAAGVWKILEDPDGYYLQLRGKVHDWQRDIPSVARLELLLFLPDLFRLYVRLLFDDKVAAAVKARLLLALAYLIVPFDLLPEAVLGPPAYIDDAFLLVTALAALLNEDVVPRGRIEQHWSGSAATLDKVLSGATFLRERTDFFHQIAAWANRTWQQPA